MVYLPFIEISLVLILFTHLFKSNKRCKHSSEFKRITNIWGILDRMSNIIPILSIKVCKINKVDKTDQLLYFANQKSGFNGTIEVMTTECILAETIKDTFMLSISRTKYPEFSFVETLMLNLFLLRLKLIFRINRRGLY